MIQFELKEEHLDLLKNGCWEYDGSCEYGSIGLDCKRPFGNSSVEYDIAEIIGDEELLDAYENDRDLEKIFEDRESKYFELYKELATALEIIFQLNTFELGVYEKEDNWSSSKWRKK